jgi:hypothetical protein
MHRSCAEVPAHEPPGHLPTAEAQQPPVPAEQPHYRAQPHLVVHRSRMRAELQDVPEDPRSQPCLEIAEGAEAPEPTAALRT